MTKKRRIAKTLSDYDLIELFPDEAAAVAFVEKCLWPGGKPICPFCNSDRSYRRPKHAHRCSACRKNFTVRVGTIFQGSNLPLHKWLRSMSALLQSRKGISSVQLSKNIGMGQKASWFLLHRLREICSITVKRLKGTVEMDEAFFGGKEKNKHANKRSPGRQGGSGKDVVMVARERGGNYYAETAPNTKSKTIRKFLAKIVDPVTIRSTDNQETIEEKTILCTDNHTGYSNVSKDGYDNKVVNHSKREYVRSESHIKVHTNNAESFWALFKRGLHGVYHHCDPRHLQRYANEVVFRLNEGNCEVDTIDRIKALVCAARGRHLTYAELTRKSD